MFGCLARVASADNICSGFFSVCCVRVSFDFFYLCCFEIYIDDFIRNHWVEHTADEINGPCTKEHFHFSFVVDEFEVMVQWTSCNKKTKIELTTMRKSQTDAYFWLFSGIRFEVLTTFSCRLLLTEIQRGYTQLLSLWIWPNPHFANTSYDKGIKWSLVEVQTFPGTRYLLSQRLKTNKLSSHTSSPLNEQFFTLVNHRFRLHKVIVNKTLSVAASK